MHKKAIGDRPWSKIVSMFTKRQCIYIYIKELSNYQCTALLNNHLTIEDNVFMNFSQKPLSLLAKDFDLFFTS